MNKLKERILEFVKERRHVSFVEIQDKFGRGDTAIEIEGNVILWANLKEEVVSAIIELLNERKLYANPTSVLVYAVDGRILKLPIAKRIPKDGYKEPHWLPVVLDIEPPKRRR